MREVVKDYLWTFDIHDIDNSRLYNTCCNVETFLRSKYPELSEKNVYGNFTSYYHEFYNLFFFASPELHRLYNNICELTLPLQEKDIPYYIRCWPNVFRQGYNIEWHNHWNASANTFHGFYCVNTEGQASSYTDYRIPGYPEVRVDSKDGLLVIGRSNGDEHRSSVWNNPGKHRVTIAFDIIPGYSIHDGEGKFQDSYPFTNFIPIYKITK